MSINLATVFQVMPYAQNIAHAEMVQPQAQQAAAALTAQEHLEKEHNQVQKVDQQDGAEEIRDEGGRHPNAQGGGGRRRKKPNPEPESEQTASNASPWSGNIINRQI